MSSGTGAPAPKDPHDAARQVIANAAASVGIQGPPHPFMIQRVGAGLATITSALAEELLKLQNQKDGKAKKTT